MCVGVDGEAATRLDRQAQQPLRRIEALRAGVDLDGDVVGGAGVEDERRVELRLRAQAAAPSAGLHDAPGAVAEDVHARVRDRRDHPPGHGDAVHAELGVHAGDDDVEAVEEFGLLVERAVLQDVDLDTGEDAERRQGGVEFVDDVELAAQAVGGQAVRDLQARRVVGEGEVLVAEGTRGLGHLQDRGPAVGPVAVGVQVALEGGAERGRGLVQRLALGGLQAAQVDGRLAAQRLLDHQGGDLADAGQRGERPVAHPAGQLVRGRPPGAVGGRAERPHAVGRLMGALQQERDAAQRFDGLHASHRTQV